MGKARPLIRSGAQSSAGKVNGTAAIRCANPRLVFDTPAPAPAPAPAHLRASCPGPGPCNRTALDGRQKKPIVSHSLAGLKPAASGPKDPQDSFGGFELYFHNNSCTIPQKWKK